MDPVVTCATDPKRFHSKQWMNFIKKTSPNDPDWLAMTKPQKLAHLVSFMEQKFIVPPCSNKRKKTPTAEICWNSFFLTKTEIQDIASAVMNAYEDNLITA